MRVGSYLELASTLIGWHLAGAIAAILTSTGLVLMPFVIAVIRNWAEPMRSQQSKVAAPVSLRRMEQDVGLFAVVIIFFFLPAIPITIDDIEYTNSDLNHTVSASEPSAPYSSDLEKLGEFQVPIIWWLVHEISSYLAHGVVDAIDRMAHPSILRAELLKASRIRITDETIITEIREFRTDCYEPALAKFQRQGDQISMSGRSELDRSVDWIGSKIFLETPGYYRKCNDINQCGTGYRSSKFRPQWSSLTNQSSTPGFPYCSHWWSHPDIGLRAKIISSMKQDTSSLHSSIEGVRAIQKKKRNDGIHLNVEDYEDRYIRRAINISPWIMVERADRKEQFRQFSWKSLTSIDGWQQIIASLGSLTVSGLIHIAMEFVVIGLPMLQALTLMLVYISIPLVVPYAVLNPSILLRVIILLFSLRFLTALWAIAEFLDERLLAQLYPDSGFFEFGGGGSSADLVLSLITLTAYLTLPLAWFYIMAAVGSRVINQTAIGFSSLSNNLNNSAIKSSSVVAHGLKSR